MTTRARGYSLWLVPSDEEYVAVHKTIRELSQQHNTQPFEPHITLLGKLQGDCQEISNVSNRLASQVPPLQVRTLGVDSSEEYFRCIFLDLERTPGLLRANRLAREFFGRETDPLYKPHASLLYAYLDCATRSACISEVSFRPKLHCTTLQLVRTEGEPKDWNKVQDFPLTQKVL